MNLNYNDIEPLISEKGIASSPETIFDILNANSKVIVVFDDDPTGTQTVYDVPVLTVWGIDELVDEINRGTSCFYILTNSRSLAPALADKLHVDIAKNVKDAFAIAKKDYIIISRSDSTLRGHYPNDVISIAQGLQISCFHTVIIPAFFEGGRFTWNDIHYVKEKTELIPAANTLFAKDKAFGFTQSNLKNWVQEKTCDRIASSDVFSFSLDEIRNSNLDYLSGKINLLPEKSTVIVNALNYSDLQIVAAAFLQSSARVIFRTAASFVRALANVPSSDLLSGKTLINEDFTSGGLIIAGSYVEKTTRQLGHLQQQFQGLTLELNVDAIIRGSLESIEIAKKISYHLEKGTHVLVFTSRTLAISSVEKENFSVNQLVADFITDVAAHITIQPKWIIAKGGITSSDIAVKSLRIKRAMVLGQVLPGVPVWKSGDESKFPGMNYIIFPGNVGEDDALLVLYNKLNGKN